MTLAQDLLAPVAVPAQMCLRRSTIPTSTRMFQTNVQEAFSAGDTTAPPSCWPPWAVPAVLYGFPAQPPDLGEPGENLNKSSSSLYFQIQGLKAPFIPTKDPKGFPVWSLAAVP